MKHLSGFFWRWHWLKSLITSVVKLKNNFSTDADAHNFKVNIKKRRKKLSIDVHLLTAVLSIGELIHKFIVTVEERRWLAWLTNRWRPPSANVISSAIVRKAQRSQHENKRIDQTRFLDKPSSLAWGQNRIWRLQVAEELEKMLNNFWG